MESAPSPEPNENSETTENDRSEYFADIVQRAIGEPRKVQFENVTKFDTGRRFLYGFTAPLEASGSVGFVKMTRIEDTTSGSAKQEQLARESSALQVASALGIPTTPILHPYREEGAYALIHLEALDTEKGVLLTSPELIASANPEYGAWVADSLSAISAQALPDNIDTALLKRTDGRNASKESFLGVFHEAYEKVLDSLTNDEDKQWLANIFAETITDITPMLESSEERDKEYFVHNDASPGNTFFDEEKNRALLLDFEHAGATHNKVLSWMTDMGNFYGRCWPNKEMQQAFVARLAHNASPEDYTKIKTVIIFGSLFLAKYATAPDHRERRMYQALVGNLKENLAALDRNALKA